MEVMSLRASDREEFDGFTLHSSDRKASVSEMERLKRSLELIRRIDTRQYRRLRRDMPRIVVAEGATPQYWRATWTALLEPGLLRSRAEPSVAIVLVEIGVFARLARSLGPKLGPECTYRARTAAIRAQVAFAARMAAESVPGAEDLHRYFREKLDGRAAAPPGSTDS